MNKKKLRRNWRHTHRVCRNSNAEGVMCRIEEPDLTDGIQKQNVCRRLIEHE